MLRDIHIHPVLNGFIVEVGCQTLVFHELQYLLEALEEYFKSPSPDAIEKTYLVMVI